MKDGNFSRAARSARHTRGSARASPPLTCLGTDLFYCASIQALTHPLSSLLLPSASVPFKVVDIDKPEIAALYDCKLVLVRPDGHVAWREDTCPDDAFALIDRVRGAGSL